MEIGEGKKERKKERQKMEKSGENKKNT